MIRAAAKYSIAAYRVVYITVLRRQSIPATGYVIDYSVRDCGPYCRQWRRKLLVQPPPSDCPMIIPGSPLPKGPFNSQLRGFRAPQTGGWLRQGHSTRVWTLPYSVQSHHLDRSTRRRSSSCLADRREITLLRRRTGGAARHPGRATSS